MIKSKKDLSYYIEQDRLMNGYPAKRGFSEIVKNIFFTNAVTHLRYLRNVEYYTNVHTLGGVYSLKHIIILNYVYLPESWVITLA